MDTRVYFLQEDYSEQFIKIGVTVRLDARISGLQCGNPRKIRVRLFFEFNDNERAYEAEGDALSYINKCGASCVGEWFDTSKVSLVNVMRIVEAHYDEDWENKHTASNTYRTGMSKKRAA